LKKQGKLEQPLSFPRVGGKSFLPLWQIAASSQA
jgi:hypothetical protein